ncbi:unnamed protein product (macronuclear) [Paramecium tetraurelia]|uniref:Dynein axonemal assembly factor 11-like CS domain-containing protein n=1 Tax=Paramecium tetraurelia TaxID=5888 RepID=A0E3R3_PARTE|nr:uncharacterized protein GSPATT00023103001 [Paramecium tetraurelia]CAK89930.1 unnamed protein product [Paramecium tetraurelia]|eukprot:XP_001457327.1 hypothetical protein (macronuclear) [Paramecium tetraurelia strain d4-2]
MSRITQELLRRRAEHNEMMLTNLEEISIHQEEILKIENLDVYCRHLKILLLQNNIIERMENLNKLRELEYLNLALNNIKLIEGIENCESLMKLDLTVNFVDLQKFRKIYLVLKELYLTGNPCTDWKGYRDYVIGQVDSLHSLDGKEITHTERIKAKQILPQLQKELIYAIEEEKIKEEQRMHEEKIRKEMNPDSEDKVAYTPETRKEMYLRQAKEKEDKERQRNPEKFKVKQETPLYMNDGRIRQCDEGGYKPIVNNWEDPENVTFKMIIPKYLDTSLIQVNVNPTYVSVRVKDKLTQIRLDEEVFAEKSKIQRSEITGELVITMPKVSPNEILKQIAERKKKEEQQKQQEQIKQQEMKQKQEKQNLDMLIQRAQAKLTQQIDDDIPDLE